MRIWGQSRIRHHSARRLGLAVTGLALLAGALPVVGAVAPGSTGIALADDTMASLNAMRTGWDNNEPALNPTAVHGMSSSPVWNAALPDGGSVYGQPLIIGNKIIVATENDDVYEYQNNGSGSAPTLVWSAPLGSPVPILTLGGPFSTCTDLTPNIGVTGTPVYDGNGHIFMFADEMKVPSGQTKAVPQYFFVELNTSDGSLVQPQVQIKGAPWNTAPTGNTFNAKYQMERPGVYYDPSSGAVYAAFASHCDVKPYDGYVIRVAPGTPPNNTTVTATYSLWSDESKVSYDQAGIWQGGGGVMADPSEPGSIYVTSGNGVSPVKGPGNKPPGTLAESVIRLVTNSNGTVSPVDFFSPANAPTLDAGDIDYGSGGPVGVPFTDAGFQAVAQIGKDGRVWLLNSQNLGGREQGTNSTDASLFVGHAYGGVWGHPAVFGDTTATLSNAGTAPIDNDFLVSIGRNDVMRVFRFAVTKSNRPWLSNIAVSTLNWGFSSGSPIVTSTQNSNPVTEAQSAVIWAVDAPKNNLHPYSGLNSELEAYTFGSAIANGKPSTCQSSAPCQLPNIWHSTTFISSKFSIPAVSEGWVYVGTRDGHLLAFAPGGTPAPAVASAVTLPQTAVGTTSNGPVTFTATRHVTVTGATASTGASNDPNAASNFGVTGQPTVNGSPATFPVKLKKGDKLSVTTTFTPSVAGASNGTLSLSTDSSTVNVPLTGEGTQQGIYAQTTDWAMDPGAPGVQTFPWEPDQHVIPVPVGIAVSETVNITNLGTVTQTITKVKPPSGQFSASNLPAVGSKLIPGQSTAVQVTYLPTSAGTATGSFTVVGSSGQKAVVTLSGVSTAAVSQFTAGVSSTPVGTAHAAALRASTAGAPVTLDFGSVPVGTTVTNYIQVNNSGNTESLAGMTANLAPPFSLPIKASLGLPINPDADLSLPVTFAPTTKGTFTAQYKLNWRDVNGLHTLVVDITGTGV